MINRLFGTMQTNVGNNVQDLSANMQTIIQTYINDIYFDLLRRTNWEAVNWDYTMTTVAGTQDYVLPVDFGKEKYVADLTNKFSLKPITLQEVSEDYSTMINTQGLSERYAIITKSYLNQPTVASNIGISSSNSADTTQTVRIRGTSAAGVFLEENMSLNGLSTVTSSNVFAYITSISKSATTTGYVTVAHNSGVTIAVLSPADLAYNPTFIRLNQIPNYVATLSIPYVRKPYPLVNTNDQPIFDCADVIELGATMKAWRYKRQFAKASEMKVEYEQAISTLMWDMANNTNRVNLFHPLPYSRNDV